MHAGHTGLLGVTFGGAIPLCERVAAAVALTKAPPVQRLSRGSGARASVRQLAAKEFALPSSGPRHGEVEPDARGRQGCAQVPAATDRAEGVVLVIISCIVPFFVTAVTHAHVFVLGGLRKGRGYGSGSLWDPNQPIKRSESNPTYIYVGAGRESFAEALK